MQSQTIYDLVSPMIVLRKPKNEAKLCENHSFEKKKVMTTYTFIVNSLSGFISVLAFSL